MLVTAVPTGCQSVTLSKFYSCADSQREAGRVLRRAGWSVALGCQDGQGDFRGLFESPHSYTVTLAGQQRLDP